MTLPGCCYDDDPTDDYYYTDLFNGSFSGNQLDSIRLGGYSDQHRCELACLELVADADDVSQVLGCAATGNNPYVGTFDPDQYSVQVSCEVEFLANSC